MQFPQAGIISGQSDEAVGGPTSLSQVVTVAADLDLDYWPRRDGPSPLAGSFDPARQPAETLGRIPQFHFTGGEDRTVKTDVAVVSEPSSPQAPVRLVEVPGFTHSCCWVNRVAVAACPF